MPSLLSNVTWVHQVMDVVENSLIDERVEVRSKAAEVLSGLLHCAFVDKPRHDSLLVRITTQFSMHGLAFLFSRGGDTFVPNSFGMAIFQRG